MTGPRLLNAMSVDVEEYFHAHALERWFTRDRWPKLERRAEPCTRRILDLLDAAGARATFFTLGCVAAERPGLVREIVARGHELASHGLDHRRVGEQTPAAFRADLAQAQAILQDAAGVAVLGYRAPSFSIGPAQAWAHDVLAETGHVYSSSLSAARLGADWPDAPQGPFRPGPGPLVEIPIAAAPTLAPLLRRTLPVGGAYARLLPLWLTRRAVAGLNARGRPATFYTHPWEIDPDQPRARLGPLTALRHRGGSASMAARLSRLAAAFAWGAMRDVFAAALADPAALPCAGPRAASPAQAAAGPAPAARPHPGAAP